MARPAFGRLARGLSLRARLAASMALILLVTIVAATVLDRLGDMPGVPRALEDREPFQDGLVLAAFSVAALALVWLVIWWSLNPLGRACREASSVGPRHPGVRLSTQNLPTEIQPLLGAVNSALDRMEQAYEAERRFTTDAAHELRTPLSVLGLRLQRARLDGVLDWAALDHDLAQMNRLVHQMLDLARREQGGRAGGATRLDLARIAREAASLVLPLAEAAGRALTVDLPDSLPVQGRADDLRDAAVILLDNALTHGAGTISLRGSTDIKTCTLSVADEGPGVPEAMREAVFKRFCKVQSGSAGAGLGLAILWEVVESHGGRVAFEDGPACLITLSMPRDTSRSDLKT